ncbi:hypothetical protein ACJMK2_018995 [Sinanodonta woodiana]|uniref:RING-type domain-containing protein n=1 Tax=Sinanodonta woodiana TaxID=1069815 RepID=A0ABD3UF64_SINWO
MALDSIPNSSDFEYNMKLMTKPEIVRAEFLQFEDTFFLDTDFRDMPYWKNEYEGCDSETNAKQVNDKDILNLLPCFSEIMPEVCFKEEKKEHCIFLQLDEMAAPRENSKDSFQNIVPSLESSSESRLVLLENQDYDNSEASWEDDFKGIHDDGLHLPQKLWNDSDIKPENVHGTSLEQDSKDMQEETENETNVFREVKVISKITEDCSVSSDRMESSALQIHQRRENSKQENNEGISPSGSGIFHRKGSFSTLPKDNDCNSVKKNTSEIGIQVGLTEEKSHMKLGTNPASGEQIATSCTEKSKSKRGVSHDFVPMDEERSLLKSHNKEILESDTDDAVSLKTEEEFQTVYLEEHSDNHNENLSFNCVLSRNYPRQMEHREIQISQPDNEYMDLKRKPVRIISLDDDKMVGTDHASDKESKASDVVGEPSDSKIKQIDPCSLLENYVPLKVLHFPEVSIEKILQEERKTFQGENQNMGFKMKTCMSTEHSKKSHVWGSYQGKLALLLKMFFGCISILDRNSKYTVKVSDQPVNDRTRPKEDKFQDDEEHCKKDLKSHEFALLKEIVSTWYFFPMLARLMEFCLPSSLQTFFERLISGQPISQAERMSYEWLRLESFNTLPSSTRGTAIRLAQSGFYYTRQGTCIRCYACNVEHEGWNNTDNLHELHQRISPNCPFLGGYPTYPNFPIIPDTVHDGNNTERSASSATPTIPVIQDTTQSRVVETQPVVIPSINNSSTLNLDEMSVPPIAAADVYHQVPSETVQVEARREKAETQGSSSSWKQQQTNSNTRAGTSQPETSPSSSSMSHPQQPTDDAENTQYTNPGNFVLIIPARQGEDPGVDPTPQTMSERPKHPEHAPLSSRITSYTRWPTHLDQTPQQMAEAGFFYAGINDYTRCFQCGGGLRNWEPGDNPWIEHARWYPQCAYVLVKKGQKFVNAVLKKQTELLAAQNAQQNDSRSSTTTGTIISGTGTSSQLPSVQQPIAQSGKPRYFQNPNENDIANRLIDEMGYQRERVREAILEVKRRRGQQEITIEHAIDLLLADEERRTTPGRQNEAATMQELIQESEQLILHDDCSPPHSLECTAVPPPTGAEPNQHSGHQHKDFGGCSSGQQQRGQTDQSTVSGRIASPSQIRQNTSGPGSLALDVPSSSVGNQEGLQSNKSTAANGPSTPTLLEPISLPALDAESLKEEYLRLRDQNICKICMERKIDLVFLPCGHLMSCQVCGQALRFCPICRAKINGSAKTYLS